MCNWLSCLPKIEVVEFDVELRGWNTCWPRCHGIAVTKDSVAFIDGPSRCILDPLSPAYTWNNKLSKERIGRSKKAERRHDEAGCPMKTTGLPFRIKDTIHLVQPDSDKNNDDLVMPRSANSAQDWFQRSLFNEELQQTITTRTCDRSHDGTTYLMSDQRSDQHSATQPRPYTSRKLRIQLPWKHKKTLLQCSSPLSH